MDSSDKANTSVDDLYGDIDEMYLSQADGDTGQFSDSSVSTRDTSKTLTSQDEMEQEVNTENENNQFDDLDLYDDMITEEDQNRIESYQEMVKKYEEAISKISKMELELQTLRESNMKHEVTSKDLQRNFTSLLITAKGELTRKEREISSLRKKLGNKARTSQYGTTPPRTATDTSSLTSIDSNFDPLCVSSPGRVTSKTVSNNQISRSVSKVTRDHVNSPDTGNSVEGRMDSRKKASERDSSPHSKSTKRDAVSPHSGNKNKQRDDSEHRSRPNSSLSDTDKVERKHGGSESKRTNKELTCSKEQTHTNSTSNRDSRKKELNSSKKEKTKRRSLERQTDKDSSEGYSLSSGKTNDKNMQGETKTPPKERTKFDGRSEKKQENRSRNTEEPKEIKVTDLREKLRLRKLQSETKDNEIKTNERELRSLKESESLQNNENKTDSSKLRKISPIRFAQDCDTLKDNDPSKVEITEPESTKKVQKKSNENLDIERAFLEQLKHSIKAKDTLKTPVSVNSKMHPSSKISTQCTASITRTQTSRAVISYSDVSCDLSEAVQGPGFESSSCFSASEVSDHVSSYETPVLSDTEQSSQYEILDRFSSEEDSHNSCEKTQISGVTKVKTQVYNKNRNQKQHNIQVDNESAGCSQNKLIHEVETCSLVNTDKSELCGKRLTEQSKQGNNATLSDVSFKSVAEECKESSNKKDKSSNKQIPSTKNSETQRKNNIVDKTEVAENSTIIENKNDQIMNEKTPENKDQVCSRIRTEENNNPKSFDQDTTPVTGRRRSARLLSKSESNIDTSIPALSAKDLCKDHGVVQTLVDTSGNDTKTDDRNISSVNTATRSSEKKKKKKVRRCVISETVSSVTSVNMSKSVQDMFQKINVDVDFEENNLESTDGTETSEDTPSSQGSQKIRDSICSDVNCKIKMKHLHPKISPKAKEDSENFHVTTENANVGSDAEHMNVIKQATISDPAGCLTPKPNTDLLQNICSEQTTEIKSDINDDKGHSIAKAPSDIQSLCKDSSEENKVTLNTVNNKLDNPTDNDACDSFNDVNGICNEMLEVAGEESDSESSWDTSSYSSSSFWSSGEDDDDDDGGYTHPSSCSTCSSSYSSETDSDSEYSTSEISSEEIKINKCVFKSSQNIKINQKVQDGRNTTLVLNTEYNNPNQNNMKLLKNNSACKDFELSRNNSYSLDSVIKQKLDNIDKNTSFVEIEVEKTLKSLCEKVESNSSLKTTESDAIAKDLSKSPLTFKENFDVLNLKNSVECTPKNINAINSASRIQAEDEEDMDICDGNLNSVEGMQTEFQQLSGMFDTQPISKGSGSNISPKKTAHVNKAKDVYTGSNSENNSRQEAEQILSVETEVNKSVPDQSPKLIMPPLSLKDNLEKSAKVSARSVKERKESETFKSPKDSEGSFGSNIVSEKTDSLLSNDDSDYTDTDDSYSDDGSGSFYSSYTSESDNSECEASSENNQQTVPQNTRGNASETSKNMFIKRGLNIKSDGEDVQSPKQNAAIQIPVCCDVMPADRSVIIEKQVEKTAVDDKTSSTVVGNNQDLKDGECLQDRNANSTKSLAEDMSKNANLKLNKAQIKVNDNNTPNNDAILHRNENSPVTVPAKVTTPQSLQISEPDSFKLKRTNNNRVTEDTVKRKNNSPTAIEKIPVTNHSPDRSHLLQCLLQCVQKEVESKYKLSNIARSDGEKEIKHSKNIEHENVPVISDVVSSQNLSGSSEGNYRKNKQFTNKESEDKGLTLQADKRNSQRLEEDEEKRDTHLIQTEQKTNKSDLKINEVLLKSNSDLHEEIFGSTLSLSDSDSESSLCSKDTPGSLSDSESLESSKKFERINSKRTDERQASKEIIRSKSDDTNIREMKSSQIKVADKKPASCKVSDSKNTSTIKNIRSTQEHKTDKPVAFIAYGANSNRLENKNAVSSGTHLAEITDSHVYEADISKGVVDGTKINSEPQGNVGKVRKQVNNTDSEQNSCDGKDIQQNVSQQRAFLHSNKTEDSNKQKDSTDSKDTGPTSLLRSLLPKSQSSFMIEDEAPNFLSSRSRKKSKEINEIKSTLKRNAGIEKASPAVTFKNLSSAKKPVLPPQETLRVKKSLPGGQLGSIDASDSKTDQTYVSSSMSIEQVDKSLKVTKPSFSKDKNNDMETGEGNLLNPNVNNLTLQSQNSEVDAKNELKQLSKKKPVSDVVTHEHIQQGSVKNSDKDGAEVSSKTVLHVKRKTVEAPRRSPRKKPSSTEVTLSKDVTTKKAVVKHVKQYSNRKNEDKMNDKRNENKSSDKVETHNPSVSEKVKRDYNAIDKQNKKHVKQYDKTRETRESGRSSEPATKPDIKNAEDKYKSKPEGRKCTHKSQLQDEKSRSVGKPKITEEKQQTGSQSYAKGKISVFEKGHFHDTTKELSDKIMKLKVEQNLLFSKLAEKDKAHTDSLTQKISLSKSKEAMNRKDTKENLFASRGKVTSTSKTNLSAPLKLAKDLNSHETEKTHSGNIVSKTGCLNKTETLSFEEKLNVSGCPTKSKHIPTTADTSLSVHTAMLKTYTIPKRSKHTNKNGKNLKSHSELSVLGKMYTTSKDSRERDSYKNKRDHSLKTTKQTVKRTNISQEKTVKISRSDSELSPPESESMSEGETSPEDDSDAIVKAIFGSSSDSSVNSKKSLTLADLRKTRSSEDTEDVVQDQDEDGSLSLVDEEDVSSSKSEQKQSAEKRKLYEQEPQVEIRSEKLSETNNCEYHNNKDRKSPLLKEKSDKLGMELSRKKDSHGNTEENLSKSAGKRKENNHEEIIVSKKYSKTSLTKEKLSPRKSPRLKAAASNESVLKKSSRTPVKTASENTMEVRYFQLSDENPVLKKIVSPRKTGSDKQKQNLTSTESIDLKSATCHKITVFPEAKGIPVLLLEDNTMDRIDYDDDLSLDSFRPSSYKNKEISENEPETSDGQISETEDNENTVSDDECGVDGDIENDSDISIEEGELTDDESYKEEHSLVVRKKLTGRSDEENPTKSKQCDNTLNNGMRKRRHISPILFPSSEDTVSNRIEEMCKCKSMSCVHKSLSDVCDKKRGKRHRSSSDSCSGVNSPYRQRRRISRDDNPAGRRSRSPVRYAGSRYKGRSKFERRSSPRSHRRRSNSQHRGVKKSPSAERRTYRSNRSRSQSRVRSRRGHHSRSRTPVKSGRRVRDRHRGRFRDHKGLDKVSPGFNRRHRDNSRDRCSSAGSTSGKADKTSSRRKKSEKTQKESDFEESVSQNEKSKEQNNSKEHYSKTHCGSELDEKYGTDSNVNETDESTSESRRKTQSGDKNSRLNHREKHRSGSISKGAKGKRLRSESDSNIDSDCNDTDNRESSHRKNRSSHKKLRTDRCTK